MLRFNVDGTGDAITFLHGFGLDGRVWDAQIAAFRATHRTVVVDLPGFGHSRPLPDARLVSDALSEMLAALGVTATHVVGHSLGGAVATDFALTHPGLVRSLVLADAFMLGHPGRVDTWETCVALARAGDCRGAIAHWLTDGVFDVARTQPAVWTRICGILGSYDCGHWTRAVTLRWAVPAPRERLGEIRAPTLVLIGELDTRAFHAMADAYVAGIPDARKVVLSGAGHVSNMEAPEAFNNAVQDFLAGS